MLTSAYYFRAHSYTIVPRHVREDMRWMADHGTDAVILSVLEQDLFAAVENYRLIADEAAKAGLKLFVTPSRWGGLVAGAPKVPSIFSSMHPEVWAQDAAGTPAMGSYGPIASVHHPATFDFFREALAALFKQLPVEGVIWDEIKNLHLLDYSPHAKEKLGSDRRGDLTAHIDSTADFFDRVGAVIRELSPQCKIGLFIYATTSGYPLERLARMENLDDFGCDGRPFAKGDGGTDDSSNQSAKKLLCETGHTFIDAARRNGKSPLLLIENHAMSDHDITLMDRRFPEVLALGPEHLLYYYYPRSVANPERNMEVIGKHLMARDRAET